MEIWFLQIKISVIHRAVANFFLNNKRKLSIDSAVADGVKEFKKEKEKSKLESFIILNFYFLCYSFMTLSHEPSLLLELLLSLHKIIMNMLHTFN